MEEIIHSKALEVNLAQTRELPIEISEKHKWFISLSENHYGIHKRTLDFFKEFHHPYTNWNVVVDQLPNLLIGDLWLYESLPQNREAIGILLGITSQLLSADLPDSLTERVLQVLLKLMEHLSEDTQKYKLILEDCFNILEKYPEEKTFSYICNLGFFFNSLNSLGMDPVFSERTLGITRKTALEEIRFWQNTAHIEDWYKTKEKILGNTCIEKVTKIGIAFFEKQYKAASEAKNWQELKESTISFDDTAVLFRNFAQDFTRSIEKFHYLFYLLHLEGMERYQDYLLWDLNKVIEALGSELSEDQIFQFIDDLFVLLVDLRGDHMGTVLDSALTLGKQIINNKNLKHIYYFEDKLIGMGFVSPGVIYMTQEWQLRVDRNHIKNIRVWLELIEYGPEIMKKLLSALVVNLRLGGIFIFDTDLFQRDITRLLNSNISPIYKQVKQLARIFPVYFNEIGAEGELREVTTTLDEISQRNDKLIHFLRKQIHTEGNNSHIGITLEIMKFWHDLKTNHLRTIVPQDVMESIDPAGKWVKGVHDVITDLCIRAGVNVKDLPELGVVKVDKLLEQSTKGDEQDRKRVSLIIKLYGLLKEKYSFETENISGILSRYRFFTPDEIAQLQEHLSKDQDNEALKMIYMFMERLNQIIFDPKPSQGWENIYHKRHIAFGIPSMYGEYHEDKFEALGVIFRLEKIATGLLESIISRVNTEYITARSLKKIFSILELFRKGLELDGMSDQGFDSNLQMFQYSLISGSFSVGQYVNIFQFMADSVKEIISTYFLRPYEEPLKIIVPQLFGKELGINSKQRSAAIQKRSETFYRELLSSAFLVQHLDAFIGKVLNNLRKMMDNFSPEIVRDIMSYDPDMVISTFYKPTENMDSQVFLGSKAFFLKKLYLKKYPVPPGFVLTTEVFRRRRSIYEHPSLEQEINDMIFQHVKELEKISGRRFGDPVNPLLLSVRSGSAISLPGAMNTFLNVGLNDEITETLSKQYNFGWTSWDCYRRLLQTWGMSYGIDRDIFDQIMLDYKLRYNVTQKIDFPPHIMREMTKTYKQILIDHKIPFEPDPFMQLKSAIRSVFDSWETPRSKVYRDHLQIAEEWGTAVIVQQMVFGNIHRESGSGVLFTHDPQESKPGISIFGDFSFLTQGEDIVAGLVNTLPLSEKQRKKYSPLSPFSLETHFPKIYGRLKEIAHELTEKHGFGHQEMEFTFETPEPQDLYILQTRDQNIAKKTRKLVFAVPVEKMRVAGRGIGIGLSVMNGRLAFDMDDIREIKAKYPTEHSILVRPDTVPDDIEMIFECDGMLTGRGGVTSHAAVTAASLGKICIVNCPDLLVDDKNKQCKINEMMFSPFDKIAIDGHLGIIYQGNYQTKFEEF
ncbi:MAG: PEP/pyruvate-binding domain-containing protein [Bacteroidota bacterium]|nr:PEP/pyruvate-binding domain-containing protein [Bacteroidota bacterium]